MCTQSLVPAFPPRGVRAVMPSGSERPASDWPVHCARSSVKLSTFDALAGWSPALSVTPWSGPLDVGVSVS
jgi:hypothetical protein